MIHMQIVKLCEILVKQLTNEEKYAMM